MAVTDEQYDRLVNRVSVLERVMNDVITAQNQNVTLEQVNQLLTLLQTQVDDLTTRLAALENRVTTIEQEPVT